MKRLIERLGQRALFAFDPETAHGLSIAALSTGLAGRCRGRPSPPGETPKCGRGKPQHRVI